MGNKSVGLGTSTSTGVFVGRIGVYKGNLLEVSQWNSHRNMSDFVILKHFGVRTTTDKHIMYSFFTSKMNFYQGNGVFRNINNLKCDKGIFSYVNYPICAEQDDFEKYVESSYDPSDYPAYVFNEFKKNPNMIEDALYNYKMAYMKASLFGKIYMHGSIKAEFVENDIMIVSSLGVLNRHNSMLFMNHDINIRELKAVNVALMNEFNGLV